MLIRFPLALCLAAFFSLANAQFSDGEIKIGVLTDMSGPYSEYSGNGSVQAARLAVEELGGKIAGKPVSIVFADHQNKVDVGAAIARKWFTHEGIDVILDVPFSAIALAVSELAKDFDKAVIFSSAASSTLTGSACSPNTVMWTHDSWAYANNTGRQVVKSGGKDWFLFVDDYVFGHALAKDLTAAVESEGGAVLGQAVHPVDTKDFSSDILKAQASGAKVVGLAMAAGVPLATAMKQGHEYGLQQSGIQFAGVIATMPDIRAVGLDIAQGMYVSTFFYWDQNQETRDFAKKLAARNNGIYPESMQAGVYSAVLHYAKALEKAGSDSGRAVVAAMKDIPIEDKLFGEGVVRPDGQATHPMYLMQVKRPEESKGPYDLYTQISITPADKAFQPLSEKECPLIEQP